MSIKSIDDQSQQDVFVVLTALPMTTRQIAAAAGMSMLQANYALGYLAKRGLVGCGSTRVKTKSASYLVNTWWRLGHS